MSDPIDEFDEALVILGNIHHDIIIPRSTLIRIFGAAWNEELDAERYGNSTGKPFRGPAKVAPLNISVREIAQWIIDSYGT